MTLAGISILRAALRNRVRDELAFAAFVRHSGRLLGDMYADDLEDAARVYLVAGTQRLDEIEAVLLGGDPGLAAVDGVPGFDWPLTGAG